MSDEALCDLARRAGLLIEWEDADGRPEVVGPETLRSVLFALGYPAGSDAEIADSRARLSEAAGTPPPLITAEAGRPIVLPPGVGARRGRLELETGEEREVELVPTRDGFEAGPVPEPGYHTLEIGAERITLAVAPSRAWTPGDAAPGRPIWGVGLQLYSLREPGSAGFGDFGALVRFAAAAGCQGADALAISPVHALFAADASRFSPYGPSSRLFLNGLYADPAPVLGEDAGRSSDDGALVDWPAAWPAKLARLRTAFDRLGEAPTGLAAEFQVFRARSGPDLDRHALFEALHGHFLRLQGARGWLDWPGAYHDPAGPAAAAFAREHAREVEFHLFLQWLARRSLDAAQTAATDAGMAVGLVADLAVGMDPGGSHAWSRPGDLLRGLNVGAPPDPLGPSGQDWGVTAFSPAALRRSGYEGYIATLRAAMAEAGGVRIDHAMGLRRLWLVPWGAGATDGAYLTYPFTDLLRLLVLESWRSRAVVIAEDLGTVPEGFREALTARGILGMQVLWFQREGQDFMPAGDWAASAAALTSTHDLPTVAGWWRGRDLDWTFRLGRKTAFPTREAAEAARQQDRQRLWDACVLAGTAAGDPPPADDPDPAVDAAVAFVASTPSQLALIQAEDLFGLEEQPNIPGTTDEHPNWRRRLPADAETLFARPSVAARTAPLRRDRRPP